MTKLENQIYKNLSNALKVIAVDAIENAGSGHPGAAIGMSDVMATLASDFLKFNPLSPRAPLRDRLIFSAGHASALLYAFLYLSEYKDFTLQDIKTFRQLGSKCAGHPEYGLHPAIEVTTGPLGQGIANAVGMAIGLKKRYGAESPKIYVICGDGCLMEGISYEAASMAGHLRLDNIVLLFDNNKISIDGPTSLCVSEDIKQRFIAQNWACEQIDGHDYQEIHEALGRAQNSNAPSIIICDTIIAKDSGDKAGSEKSHGAPLGPEYVEILKKNIGVENHPFFIPMHWQEDWHRIHLSGSKRFLNISDEGKIAEKNNLEEIYFDIKKIIKEAPKSEASRAASGRIIRELEHKNIIYGSADLSMSNNIKSSSSIRIKSDDFSGNFIHYGVREHAMGAIMSGLALCGFLPVAGSFLVFSDYMRPAMRLACIMNLHVIYIMTHDSIGVGQDGPTHQPVEHLASLRAMPGLLVMRPSGAFEVAACWRAALDMKMPTVMSLSRQKIDNLNLDYPNIVSDKASGRGFQGAYIAKKWIKNKGNRLVKIFSTGSELTIGFDVAQKLFDNPDIEVNIELISIPSFELFFMQDREYIQSILSGAFLKVAIEAASHLGWERIIGEDGLFCGMDDYGASAPADDLYKYFKIDAQNIYQKILIKISK